jgi:hypothetical protein
MQQHASTSDLRNFVQFCLIDFNVYLLQIRASRKSLYCRIIHLTELKNISYHIGNVHINVNKTCTYIILVNMFETHVIYLGNLEMSKLG